MRCFAFPAVLRFLLLAACAWSVAAGAAPVRTERVEAELVAETATIAPGTPFTVALRLKMDPEWHTYWRNPGDSGLPTTIAWTLPPGFQAGDIQWPAPKALPVGPLVNYGFENEVLLLVDLQAPATLAVGSSVTLRAKANWLVCKEVCIPESADLALTLPVTAAASGNTAASLGIAATRNALPRAPDGWRASAHRGPDGRVTLAFDGAPAAAWRSAVFFPHAEGKLEPAGAQPLTLFERGAQLALPPAAQPVGKFLQADGVLVTQGPDGTPRAYVFDTTIVTAAAPELGAVRGVASGEPALGLAVALLFAFGGGLILNLMPCVFPILSIKVLGAVRQAHGVRREQLLHGLLFAAGVLVTFLALASALLALRAGGAQLGWGFQLQSPATVAVLAALFFLLGLNLSGVFEFSLGATGMPQSAHPHVNAFLGGVLAAVVASPCTAPFMGAAMGYAVTQPAAVALAVFAALALGMSLPFVLLCAYPAWLKRLPKPGPWMARFRQVLAFPLYATVVWLAWVLGTQSGIDVLGRFALALVALGFAAWALGLAQAGAGKARLASAAGVLLALWLAWPAAAPATVATDRAAATDEGWETWSPVRVAELTAAGTPVFVDFTAAWCVTCQVNKQLVLRNPTVRAAFAERGVALLRADWTNRDPAIGAALAALGRTGVPVYVLHRPGAAPQVLPELLREQVVLDALAPLDRAAVTIR
ncbi:MAG: protein-disulfide reductase DsbD family protein [Burkholderiales bacterium]